VIIITYDGRTLCGKLVSNDITGNMVLSECEERIIRDHDDSEKSGIVMHGVYLVRGDSVTVCGLVDEELDKSIDWTRVRGKPIGTTKH